MKVLFMAVMVASTAVALQVKIQNLIPLVAEENDLIVEHPNEENEEHGNTTLAQTFLLQEQLQGDVTVTCAFTTDNYVHKVYLDGEDKTTQVKGNLNSWPAKKTIVFSSSVGIIAVFGRDAEAGCRNGGFAMKCSSADPAWNGLVSDLTWKVKGKMNDANVATACPAGWADASYDDSNWKNARWGSTTYADGVIGVPDICGDGNSWCFRKTVKATATTAAATTEAAVGAEGTRSAQSINQDFSKLVHEKFSQEAAHGTWNLQLNLDTDPCSVLTCKASSQCHAVGTCSKAAGGVCSDPFLAAGTPCNDEVQNTVNDVCDGKGGCAGVNIDLGCLEMHYDASKFAKDYRVQTWKDLSKKGHDATAYSTVPNVRVDQNNKNMPYVPIIPNRYFKVNGPNTFVKTIVSVFRSGDDRTTWSSYGATLARRSGRSHNWLFQSGNKNLHSNQFPQKAWKNGKELTQGNGNFNMEPINKFFVLVIEVKGTGGKTSHYLGRSDHSVARIDLQEVLGYDRILTDAERKNVEAYLTKKWNIKA